MVGIQVIFLLMGGLFIGMGIPLMNRKVPPNSLYGLRVGETMANEEVWYEANAACGKEFVVLGVGTCLLTVVLSFFPWSDSDLLALSLAGFVTVGSLVVAGRGMAVAREIHKRVVGEKEEKGKTS